jgi:hypothetical protein
MPRDFSMENPEEDFSLDSTRLGMKMKLIFSRFLAE